MLILRLQPGEKAENIQIGDAVIHVRKVGERKFEMIIDAPASVLIRRMETGQTLQRGKPVEEQPPPVIGREHRQA